MEGGDQKCWAKKKPAYRVGRGAAVLVAVLVEVLVAVGVSVLVAVLVAVADGTGVSVAGGGGVSKVARAANCVKSTAGVSVGPCRGVMENGSPQAMIQIIKIANVMAYCHFPFIKHLPGVHTGEINIHQTII